MVLGILDFWRMCLIMIGFELKIKEKGNLLFVFCILYIIIIIVCGVRVDGLGWVEDLW